MSGKDFDELNEEEIFGEDAINEEEIEFEDEEFGEDEVLYEDEEVDHEDEDYDYITAEDIPDYTVKSLFAIVVSIPLVLGIPFGLVSFLYANKTKNALSEDDLHDAIENSDKAGLFFKISLFITIVLAIVIPLTLGTFIMETYNGFTEVVEVPVKAKTAPSNHLFLCAG